jgi:hypothetical protein
MEPDLNWYRAPEGHFWYWEAADDLSPPFEPNRKIIAKAVTAPIPQNREEMARYIHVGVGLENGKFYWRGEYLSEFPQYGVLSEEDEQAWKEWLESDKARNFIDRAIVKCQVQAEINKDARGHAYVKLVPGPYVDGIVIGSKEIDNPLDKPH